VPPSRPGSGRPDLLERGRFFDGLPVEVLQHRELGKDSIQHQTGSAVTSCRRAFQPVQVLVEPVRPVDDHSQDITRKQYRLQAILMMSCRSVSAVLLLALEPRRPAGWSDGDVVVAEMIGDLAGWLSGDLFDMGVAAAKV